MQKPSIGRIVIARVDPSVNNGSNEAPALITRVWSEYEDRAIVNIRIILDRGTTPLEQHATSVYLYDEKPSDDQLAALAGSVAAWWPPRV